MSQIIIEQLLQPITVEKPTGEDLRADNSIDSLYYQIKDQRNAARDIERRVLLDATRDETPQWQLVEQHCITVLSEHSKDIEVATWLIEALLRQRGLQGLAIGFTVLAELLDRYWDSIYPLPEADDIASRVMAITSLNGEDYDGTLIQPLYQIMISSAGSVGPFVLWQYQQAMENVKYTDNVIIQKKRDQGAIFLDEIAIAVAETGKHFYQALLQDLDNTQKAFEQLTLTLRNKCVDAAPPSSQIKTALHDIGDHIRFLVNDAPFTLEEPHMNNEVINAALTPEHELDNVTVQASAMASEQFSSDIVSRIQAIEQLKKIAMYFRQTEPQSPLPDLLNRAVRWGNMPFSDLLKEIIKDESVRNNAYELIGLDNERG